MDLTTLGACRNKDTPLQRTQAVANECTYYNRDWSPIHVSMHLKVYPHIQFQDHETKIVNYKVHHLSIEYMKFNCFVECIPFPFSSHIELATACICCTASTTSAAHPITRTPLLSLASLNSLPPRLNTHVHMLEPTGMLMTSEPLIKERK